MEFDCVEETDLILIHSQKLSYGTFRDGHSASLRTVSDAVNVPSVKSTWVQNVTQYLVIQLDGKLTKGQTYELYTKFTGELADDLGGFYRSEYDEDGQRKYVRLMLCRHHEA